MKTKATVLKTDGECATVRVIRKSACDGCQGCSSQGSCHAEIVIAEMPNTYDLVVENTLGAKYGDIVEIESETRLSLLFAFITFILPIVATICAYSFTCGVFGTKGAVLTSLATFILSFGMCAFVADKVSKCFGKTSICKIYKESGN